MRNKFYIGLGIFLFAALLAMTLMNRQILSSVDKKTDGAKYVPPVTQIKVSSLHEDAEERFNVEYALKPQDPKDFGIVNDPIGRQNWGDTQWELYSERVLENFDALDLEKNTRLYSSLKKTPAQYNERFAQIEQRILECEVVLLKNPSNESAKVRLEALYKMKATLVALRHKILDDAMDAYAMELSAVSR